MNAVKTLEISQDILDSARLTMDEAKAELAVYLYSQGRLSLGKARELTKLSLWEFRQLLASRQIAAHYDVDDLKDDLSSIQRLGQR